MLNDLGKKRFKKDVRRYAPVADDLAANLVELMWDRFFNKEATPDARRLEDAVTKVLDKEHASGKPDWGLAFGPISDLERRAFIVGFETAAKLFNGGAR